MEVYNKVFAFLLIETMLKEQYLPYAHNYFHITTNNVFLYLTYYTHQYFAPSLDL